TTLDTSYFVLFSSCFSDASDLPSFPTRRSSDLGGGAAGARQRTPSCTGRPPTSRRSWMNLRRRLLLVLAGVLLATGAKAQGTFKDRKSTRLNSSHVKISYAVFCLKKKKTNTECY